MGDEKEQCKSSSFSIPTPFGALTFNGGAKRNAEIISILCLVALFLIAYVTYNHDRATLEHNKYQTMQTDRLIKSIEDNAKAQKFLACIVSRPMSEREEEFRKSNGICHRTSSIVE